MRAAECNRKLMGKNGKKVSCPPDFYNKNSWWPEITHPSPQELNGRPLKAKNKPSELSLVNQKDNLSSDLPKLKGVRDFVVYLSKRCTAVPWWEALEKQSHRQLEYSIGMCVDSEVQLKPWRSLQSVHSAFQTSEFEREVSKKDLYSLLSSLNYLRVR